MGVVVSLLTGCSGPAEQEGRPVPAAVTAAPPAALDIPRIPWDGGPQYWARFPLAAARGWADPSFFPVSVWFASVTSQHDVDLDKEIGINTYMELTEDSRLDLIRRNGMSAVHGKPDLPDIGAETVGWLLADEPEQFGQGPGAVAAYLQERIDAIAAKHPEPGRFRYTNFTGNMIFPNYSPGDDVASGWLGMNDASSVDVYWYTRNLECGGSVAGEIWRDGSGAPQQAGGGFADLSAAECHRAANYGYVLDRVRGLDALTPPLTPQFAFVENGHPFDAGDPTITPEQMAGAVWNSLIHGARGINYFNHSFTGDCESSQNFRDPVTTGRACYRAMRAEAAAINDQVRRLAPVLNTQSLDFRLDPTLDTMLKAADGAYYVFAMPSATVGGSTTGRHTLRLPPGLSAPSAEVLFENRTVPVDRDGTFTDDFPQEHTYHIYRITPA